MGQDGEDRPGRPADLSGREQDILPLGTVRPAGRELAPRAGLPGPARGFQAEIRAALRYERGLVAKAAIALALVALVVALRLLYLG